jgi:hypothetical protein
MNQYLSLVVFTSREIHAYVLDKRWQHDIYLGTKGTAALLHYIIERQMAQKLTRIENGVLWMSPQMVSLRIPIELVFNKFLLNFASIFTAQRLPA